MRPDKKKRNRGKIADKSEDTQGQGKSVEVVPEKLEVTKTSTEKSSDKTESLDKEKLATTTTPANENANFPPLNLRRETDALKETKKPSKRQIFSDWKEYDQPILPEEIEQDQLHDFSVLIQQKISENSYFKFKHERQWENDTCAINKDLFNLNLQYLSAGLQCIPFHERLNISTDLFSENEVARMVNCAKEQGKFYEEILDSQDTNPIYTSLLQKLKQEEKFDEAVKRDVTSETTVELSQGGLVLPENELIKCLEGSKQGIVNEPPLIPSEESKINGVELLYQSGVKSVGKEIGGIDKRIEVDSKLSQEENHRVAETKVISVSTPVNEHEVKDKSKKEISEPPEKPLDDITTGTEVVESSPMDMATVFETAPLGQRVKPQRSKDKKAKSKTQVDSPAEEDPILDSLLSLKEPTIPVNDSKKKEEELENEADELTDDLKTIVIHDKKENLEDWLDSMLDD